jgi:hypothetical protein
MRWDRLFADIEARFEAEQQAANAADVDDLIRTEWGRISLGQRLRAHVGHRLAWRLRAGEVFDAELSDVGADWVLLRSTSGHLVVPEASVVQVGGLTGRAEPGPPRASGRFPLTSVLRGMARDRAVVRVTLTGGGVAIGTVDRVGADHFDLATHPPDVPRRPAEVRSVVTVVLPRVIAIATDPPEVA